MKVEITGEKIQWKSNDFVDDTDVNKAERNEFMDLAKTAYGVDHWDKMANEMATITVSMAEPGFRLLFEKFFEDGEETTMGRAVRFLRWLHWVYETQYRDDALGMMARVVHVATNTAKTKDWKKDPFHVDKSDLSYWSFTAQAEPYTKDEESAAKAALMARFLLDHHKERIDVPWSLVKECVTKTLADVVDMDAFLELLVERQELDVHISTYQLGHRWFGVFRPLTVVL